MRRATTRRGALFDAVVALRDARSADGAPALDPFVKFVMSRAHDSYSQRLQDLLVLYLLSEKMGGFFVEFGAADGETNGNTALLERSYGWSGILSEPARVWHEALHQNRSCTIDS